MARCPEVLQGCTELPSLSFSVGSAGFFLAIPLADASTLFGLSEVLQDARS
jgi:hypothetical protein